MTISRSRGAPRGLTLIEVMVALAILAIAILGLVGGLVVASSANGWAATRTQMSGFAQSRLERLVGQVKGTICSSVATDIQGAISCSVMATAPSPFNPDVPAGTGGWMMDIIDWPSLSPSGGTPAVNGGDDVMYGPVVVLGDSNAVDTAKTLALRSTIVAGWAGGSSSGDGTGCDSTLVQSNPAVLCREIHIEPYDVATGSTSTDGGVPTAHLLRVWVRVLRGGTTDWHIGSVLLQENLAQQ